MILTKKKIDNGVAAARRKLLSWGDTPPPRWHSTAVIVALDDLLASARAQRDEAVRLLRRFARNATVAEFLARLDGKGGAS